MTETTTTTTNNIEIGDLWYLLKAIEIAGSKNVYNELEVKSFKPSFDRVHEFLVNYQAALKADADKQAAANATTVVAEPVAAVSVDPVEGITKVNVKPKAKAKAAKKNKGA